MSISSITFFKDKIPFTVCFIQDNSKRLFLLKYKIAMSIQRIIALLFFMLLSDFSFAQFPEELGDICYDIGFRYMTTDIDPIEGAYSASIDSKILLGDEVIKQNHSDGDITIYSNSKGTIRDYNNKFEFCRIGKTQSYDVNVLWPEYDVTQHTRVRIEGTDFFNISFTLKYELPQTELKNKFGDHYVSGLKVVYTIHCKKILPDIDLIKQASAILENRKAAQVEVWSGSGFSITKNFIVTNFHVIDKAKSIYITNDAIKDTLTASVIVTDRVKDIAILSIDNCTLPLQKYSILNTSLKTGTNILVLGYPLTSTMGNEIKATSGIISSQTGYKGDKDMYQISAPIQPGNSGGPLFDFSGNVIGIVCAHHSQAENVGYAIKIGNLIALCNSSGILLDEQTSTVNDGNKKLSDIIEQVKQNVFHIICINQ